MTHELALLPGVFRVGGDSISHAWDSNVYLAWNDHDDSGHILIDAGSLAGAAAIHGNLRRIGVEPEGIGTIIVTHPHWDHISAAATFPRATVWLHPADIPAVERRDFNLTSTFLYDGMRFPDLTIGGHLSQGQIFDCGSAQVEVHHTPGHTPGSTSFVVDIGGTRLLVAGDTLWGHYHWKIRSNLKAWRRSLDSLALLRCTLVTAGHTGGALGNAEHDLAIARACFGAYMNPWFEMAKPVVAHLASLNTPPIVAAN